MVLAPKDPNLTFDELLKELPPDYKELAIEFKAFCRQRKIKSPAQLMQIVMAYCGVDKVLREVAGNFTLLHERITDTAVHKRLKACLPWIKALLQSMWPNLDKASGLLRFVMADGSSVQAPGAKGTGHRLHVMMDLLKLEILYIEVTDKRTGEQIDRYPFNEGDVVVVDRGYNQPERIIDLSKRDVFVVLRLNPWAMPFYWRDADAPELNQQPLDLYAYLKQTQENKVCLPVWLGKPGKVVESWIHAVRLPPDKAAEARRKCRKSHKNKNPGKKTLFFAGWRLIFTTVPPKILDTDTIMSLYGLRWQVELLIKRLKSVLDIDELRARQDGVLADVWLHGKLLYALVVEKRVRRQFGEKWFRLTDRQATWWRYWKLIRDELAGVILEPGQWKKENYDACRIVMQERPRKRRLQSISDGLLELIESCRKLGVLYD